MHPKELQAFGSALADHASEDGEHAAKDRSTILNAVPIVQLAFVGQPCFQSRKEDHA